MRENERLREENKRLKSENNELVGEYEEMQVEIEEQQRLIHALRFHIKGRDKDKERAIKNWNEICGEWKLHADYCDPIDLIEELRRENEAHREVIEELKKQAKVDREVREELKAKEDLCNTFSDRITREEKINNAYKIEQKKLLLQNERMKYLLAQGKFNEDGTWTREKWAVDRWLRQSSARYEDLSEDEIESDRGEVEIYLGELVKGNNLATLLEENLRLAKENERLCQLIDNPR